jgi:hypothetical protein
MFYFKPGTAPIAPLDRDNSSSLILYTDKADSLLYVQKIDSKGALIGSRIPLNDKSYPLDIIASPLGFYVMAADEDKNKLWVALYSYAGKEIWKRKLINNPLNPVSADPM